MVLGTNSLPCFIDFEASSLGTDSYPIEVAWSLEDGSIECHLINPSSIKSWTDWSDASQNIHGIERQQLFIEGKDPQWVVDRMNTVLSGKVVLSNACEYDWGWCDTLFRAVNEKMQFSFGDAWHVFRKHIHIEPSLSNILLDQAVRIETVDDEIRKISEQAWKLITGKRHRASVDVQQLITMHQLIATSKGKLL